MANMLNAKSLGFDWPKLERVEGDIARLEEDRRATTARMNALQGEQRVAEAKERDTYATALLEGKAIALTDAPKTSAVEKVEAERESLKKRGAALDAALQKLVSERLAVVKENRVGWQREVREKVSPVAASLEKAANELAAAVEELNRLVSLIVYLEAPEQRQRASSRVGTARLVDGKQVSIAQVLPSVVEAAGEVREASAKHLSEGETSPDTVSGEVA